MNELIKEMAFKSGAKLYSEPPMKSVTGISMTFDGAEQFAEMIINQCAFQIAQRTTEYYSDNYVVQDFMVDVINDIKDKFGIE